MYVKFFCVRKIFRTQVFAVFNTSNGLMIKCLFNSMFDELKGVKCFKEITDFKSLRT